MRKELICTQQNLPLGYIRVALIANAPGLIAIRGVLTHDICFDLLNVRQIALE